MDQIQEVKETLAANSTTTTVDELKARGRSKVKVVKAEQIAAMISEAVHRAVDESGLLSQDEHEQLVQRSREEFQDVIRQREREVAEARRAAEELNEVKAQLEVANQRAEELRQALEEARANAGATGGGGGEGGGLSAELMFKLMNEIAELKANTGQGGGGQGASGDPGALTEMLDKLAGTLNERLDKFGRKIGISTAVEADNVKFDSLFNQDVAADLESNMDDVQVKKKTGGGIGSNLERLKKLKGGG